MINRTTMTVALGGAGAAALALLAVPADARPIYMKYGDIKGEVADSTVTAEHEKWIVLESLSIAGSGPQARGGVNVAAGDITGDGRGEAPPAGPRGVAARGPDPVPVGLLLPAVQKVREAAARMPEGETCRTGPVRGPVAIRESESGATGRILDATVTKCSSEQISLNFTKIEWD